MITQTFKLIATIAVLLVSPMMASAQIAVDQVIDFEDGSVSGFVVGGAAPASVQPSVVTDGTGNSALQLLTNGASAGPGHALQVFNNDFDDLSQAVGLLFLATNPNNLDLNVRISISAGSSQGNLTSPTGAFTSDEIVLAAGATEELTFLFDDSNFTQIAGTDSFEDTLASIQQLRIFHNPLVVASPFGLAGADAIGGLANPVAGSLLIDNVVAASAIPEPTSLPMLLLAVAGYATTKRNRK